MTKDKVIYLKKDNIPKLDVKNDTQKRRLCVGIAKFYVKVAHIFACIMKTINPTISYSDNAGKIRKIGGLRIEYEPSYSNAAGQIRRTSGSVQ